MKCSSTCWTCDGLGCLSCLKSVLYNHTCLPTCPDGFYEYYPTRCTNCDPICKTCLATSKNFLKWTPSLIITHLKKVRSALRVLLPYFYLIHNALPHVLMDIGEILQPILASLVTLLALHASAQVKNTYAYAIY